MDEARGDISLKSSGRNRLGGLAMKVANGGPSALGHPRLWRDLGERTFFGAESSTKLMSVFRTD
jgi:hypothetical protein